MILQNIKQLILLLALVLMCGCSDGSEKLDYLVCMPKQGGFINGKFSVGDKLPTFTANDTQGVPVLVDDSKYGDRYTMVIFWRSEVGFCEYKLPRYLRLFERYKRYGVGVISINADYTAETSQTIASTPTLPWTSLHDTPENDLPTKLNLSAWPSMFLLDREGRIITSHTYTYFASVRSNFWSKDMHRIDTLDLMLERLLKDDSDKIIQPSQKLGKGHAS